MIDEEAILQRWNMVGAKLDERGRRLFASGEARAAGRGGRVAISRVTGIAPSTIGRALEDLGASPLPAGRVRRMGGGRRPLTVAGTTLIEDLERLVEPATMGDPVRPLLWVSKSHEKLSVAMRKPGHKIGDAGMASLDIRGDAFHPEWNYTIAPRPTINRSG